MNMSFYVGALGASNSTKKLSVISNNLANVNTAGFKPKTTTFTELINYNLNDSPEAETNLTAGAGMRVQSTSTNFENGGFTQTGGQYDFAIGQSNAFFMLKDPVSGELAYTRNGRFHRGETNDGYYLMTNSGKLVLDQNQQPIKLEVADPDQIREEMAEGYEQEYQDYDNEEEGDQPRVSLYTFANPSRLLNVGDSEFVPSDPGAEPVLADKPVLVSGSLEASGTDMARELARLIECQQAFSYASRMVTTSDEIEGTINSLRG
ncbi:MAG: flagellar hook-basal body protein [Lachnospiraceae bacterium]